VRSLLACLMVLARREVSKDAELLVLRHENAVLRRQIGRVRYQRADSLWLAALCHLIPRRQWGEVFAVTRQCCSPGTGVSPFRGLGERVPPVPAPHRTRVVKTSNIFLEFALAFKAWRAENSARHP
jgi:hypothetical protein